MDTYFLDLDEVLRIHHDQIDRYGGEASVRDIGLLESAVSMPQAGFGGEFLHADLYEMGAAYLFHIAQNHPFVDGNKRTGLASALMFFELNKVEIEVGQDVLADMVIDVTTGKLDKPAIAAFFRAHSRAKAKPPSRKKQDRGARDIHDK